MRRASSGPGRHIPPSAEPDAEAQAELAARQLAQDIEELRGLKAEDRAAKLRGDHQVREQLGRRIYELARAIERAREGHSG